MKIAFLGLGTMGHAMAINLSRAAKEVTVWNRTPGKFVDGARVAASPAEASKGADVIWLCVTDTDAVEQVLFAERGVASVLRPGMVVVDSSTISATATKQIAERITAAGAEYVDAPVSGSKGAAQSAQLVILAGGPDKTIAYLQPLFDIVGKKTVHMGPTGSGSAAKSSLNLMMALLYEGLAEGLTLARKLGVPAEKMLDLVSATAIRSGVSDFKGPTIVKRNFEPQFPVALMHKDIQLMLEAAEDTGTKLPALECLNDIYKQAMCDGIGKLDYSATILTLERLSGIATTEEVKLTS